VTAVVVRPGKRAARKTAGRKFAGRKSVRSKGAAAKAANRNVRRDPVDVARARRRTIRRRVLGTVLAVTLLAGGGVGAVYGYGQAKAHGLLAVREIALEGMARLPEAMLLKRIGLPQGIALPDVDVAAVSSALLSHPWVERVSVRRMYPGTLWVRIWERSPAAVITTSSAATSGEEVMVDREGVVLGDADDAETADLPRLTGIDARRKVAGERVDAGKVALGLAVAKAWGPDALVDVADPEDPLLLVEALRVRLGAKGGYRWRLARLSALRPEIVALASKKGAEVDLRYDDRVIARPL
jgi:cell division protein FtsQ